MAKINPYAAAERLRSARALKEQKEATERKLQIFVAGLTFDERITLQAMLKGDRK